jgi:hypothetical protein
MADDGQVLRHGELSRQGKRERRVFHIRVRPSKPPAWARRSAVPLAPRAPRLTEGAHAALLRLRHHARCSLRRPGRLRRHRRLHEDGDDGAGLAGSTGSSSPNDIERGLREALLARVCRWRAPELRRTVRRRGATWMRGRARGDARLHGRGHREHRPRVTCEGLGLCVGQATNLARCACEVDSEPCPF